MAGYAGRTLVEKLGIKQGANICIINAPDNYDELIDEWPLGVSITRDILDENFDFIHYFARRRSQYEASFNNLKAHLDKKGMLWVSWPKGVSKLQTDLNENIVRELALERGLVDVKVAAVDETWSGLKLVYRVRDR